MDQPQSNDYNLLVLSCPSFSDDDMAFIQETRKRLDPDNVNIIPPHFTHVLPLDLSWQRTIETAAKELAGQFNPINFEVKTLTILDDQETGEQFLVLILKDYEPLLKLHSMMYERMGLPAPFGEDWIPHLTIGVSDIRQKLIDEAKVLKQSVVGMSGLVDSIEIIKWQPGEIEIVTKFQLGNN